MAAFIDTVQTTVWQNTLNLRRFLNNRSIYIQIVLASFIIAAYTLGIYFESAIQQKRFFMPDDVVQIDYIKEHGPFDAFYKPVTSDELYFAARYFRPAFTLQTWVLYQLFDFNIRRFLAASFAFHIFSTVILFLAFRAIAKDFMISLILALIYVGHFYVRALLFYVSDTAAFTIMFQGIVILLIVHFRDHPLWYLALAAALFALPLTRENGLAVNAGLIVYCAYATYKKYLTKRQSLIIILSTLAAIVLYFALRTYVSPDGARAAIDNGGYFFQDMTLDQLQALSPNEVLAVMIYYWAASVISVVLPIFRAQGTITIGDGLVTLSILATGIFVTYVVAHWHRWKPTSRNLMLAAAAIIGVVIPLTLTSLIEFDPTTSYLALRGEGVIFGFHALAAILTIYFLVTQWSSLSVQHRGLVLFMLVTSILAASIGVVYYRFRHLRYPLVCVLICIAIAYANVPASQTKETVRKSIGVFSTALAAITLIAALPY